MLFGFVILVGFVYINFPVKLNNSTTNEYTSKLFVPPLLDYEAVQNVKNFSLTAQEGNHEFVKGKSSKTYGYNGNILGPTIRFSEGDKININVTNNLDEQTTTHWHGGVVPGNADGGVHNIIKPNTSWNAQFDVIQEAATLWYHPHQHEETAKQVYNGLGGFIIIDDENSRSLPIPQEYGVDDFPIILQSKNLDEQGFLMPYHISQMDKMHGFEGNTLVTNGQLHPFVKVGTNFVRLRILNGSNSDTYNLSFDNGASFYVIASDGGFYDEPILTQSLDIATAQRYELLIDITENKGNSVWLQANGRDALEIKVNQVIDEKYSLPSRLNSNTIPDYPSQIDREFNLELLRGGGSPTYGINGKLFNMERVDFEVKNNSVEYWKIKNIPGGPGLYHPFHVHASQFYVVEFNGKTPSELLKGRHDTILLKSREEAVIAIPFDKSLEGLYLYHCHILEHEDAGMMGQFRLVK